MTNVLFLNVFHVQRNPFALGGLQSITAESGSRFTLACSGLEIKGCQEPRAPLY